MEGRIVFDDILGISTDCSDAQAAAFATIIIMKASTYVNGTLSMKTFLTITC